MKLKPYRDETSGRMAPLNFSKMALEKVNPIDQKMKSTFQMGADVDIDLREVYFLIMHFLSAGPCKRTYGQFWNELLEHQLLPRRYHAWYSRSGARSGDENDDGMSLPLCYINLAERYGHIEKDHLLKLLKQLLMNSTSLPGIIRGVPSAADVPTLLGSGCFSLLESDRDREDRRDNKVPRYLRWPHMQADQVRGLRLREIGGGFTKHHRAPSIRAACYVIAKPSTLVQKMEIIKKLRGHQNAVYCATFDRLGRYVITGSDDRLVKIWSMETAFCLASCRGHEGDITDLAVSSNNALVASSANDFIIRVWRLPDGHPISVLKGHTGAVTAIAFSPRPSAVYQLLSSSDDGTCRIWDSRQSNAKPRIYIPKPPDSLAGKNTDPSPSTGHQTHQILCCAFNANGTVFVTGSSDTYARVWNAFKSNNDYSEQPNHEMDLLSGHENDVNYVQFSGCVVGSRCSVGDALKEDNLPRFKNSWFTHDNIVTCSRDGSAIIWIPRSRRSHGKVGRWTRAYHLKVPPPPMPPQPPRGGPRQRYQPTPRGVNMIVWSLDNRFVLATIMDCRICVWNASDGSLVHSLIGHKESTFVLDVHPFNPRIAMSAGYDGKMIIWDIWEGKPVRIYETGHYKLVDGKFSPDGTSVILSDEVGQIFIIATGQGESQKDAKYDQFFLGDYRPLMQDASGNALDQETQLTPYRRNIQDLLCDSSMIPYPEPYQSMYQRRRLGILGIEWRPTSLTLAVGPMYNVSTGDFQPLPILDLEPWIEPLPEVVDAIDWEVENDMQSDDTDSEYNVAEECSSEGEPESLSNISSGDAESSAEEEISVAHDGKDGLRRSKRKKHKSEAEYTSSGRRVKRRNLDERDGATISRAHRPRKSRNGHLTKKKSSKSEASRPQRLAKTNALTFFSKITGGSSDDEDNEPYNSSSESESLFLDSRTRGIESKRSMQNNLLNHAKENDSIRDEGEDAVKPSQTIDPQTNQVRQRRLIVKLPLREPRRVISRSPGSECRKQDEFFSFPVTSSDVTNQNRPEEGEPVVTFRERQQTETSIHPNLSIDYQACAMKWGEVKQRSSKRPRLVDMATEVSAIANICSNGVSTIKTDAVLHSKQTNKNDFDSSRSVFEVKREDDDHGINGMINGVLPPESHKQDHVVLPLTCNDNGNDPVVPAGEDPVSSESRAIDMTLSGSEIVPSENENLFVPKNIGLTQQVEKNVNTIYQKLQIKSREQIQEGGSSFFKLKSIALDGWTSTDDDGSSHNPAPAGQILYSVQNEDNEGTSGMSPDTAKWNNGSENSEGWTVINARLSLSHDSEKTDLECRDKMYNAVYKRTKFSRGRKNSGDDIHVKEETTSESNDHDGNVKVEQCDTMTDCGRTTRSMGAGAPRNFRANKGNGNLGASSSAGRSTSSAHDELICDEWKSTSKMTVGLRSSRNRRGNYNFTELRPLDKRNYHQPIRKPSWLMLLEHEESYRYIPQKGDEVAYLRQGHQEYIESSGVSELGPWKLVKGLKAVEFCKVRKLEYSTLAGSGDSCCKLTLEFVDPCSSGFGKAFRVSLPELTGFPDFLVERTRYDASIERNWTLRDKCQVWWRDGDGGGGSWWDGRITALRPKSSEFQDSPWERYAIKYKDDSSVEQLHSPWELHDASAQWKHPCIDDETRDNLLNSIAKIEKTSLRNKDCYGVQKLNQVAQKSDYLNRYPVPLSLEVIKKRLENNYYRAVDAVRHDADVVIENAESYFSKSTEMMPKLRRLSECITRTFPSS